jgi:chromosome segregation ATPase
LTDCKKKKIARYKHISSCRFGLFSERYKEQNWGLEVTNEELRTSLAESSQFVNKSKIENARLTKQLRMMSEQNDTLKTQVEKASSASESTKLRHEQDIQALKRTIANLQRENMTFKEKVQSLDSELDIQRTKLSIRSISNDGTNRDEKPSLHRKLQDVTPQSSTSTPIKSSNQQLELTTAKQSLTHAHRMINNLRTSLQKEKQEKHELTKLLSDSQETVENLQHEVSNLNALGKSRAKAQKRIERKTSKRIKPTGAKATMVSATTGVDSHLDDVSTGASNSQAAEQDWDDTVDDSASEKSFNHDLMDISYMNGDTEMQSLGSELANSLTLHEQLAPANAKPDAQTIAQTTGKRFT